MSYKINFGEGAVCLPEAALDACAEPLQFRLLMLLSLDGSMKEADDCVIAERLGCTEKELADTVASLRAVKLLAKERRGARSLSGEEMACVIESDRQVGPLIDECQNLCGKIFTPSEVSKIVSLRSDLGYDCETLLLLFFFLHEKLDAVGKKMSVSYLERYAYTLYGQGIRTIEQMQAYIKEDAEKNSVQSRLRGLFGMKDRALSAKEKRFFDKWTEEWKFSFEMIRYAFDITVDRIGEPKLDFMSKILSNWKDSGITTLEQAEKSSLEYKSSETYRKKYRDGGEKAGEEGEKTFNTDEFFEKALKRSYAMMQAAGGDGKGEEESHGV